MVVQILSGIHLEFFFCFRKTLPNRDLNSGPFVKNYNAPTQPSELSHLLNHHRELDPWSLDERGPVRLPIIISRNF